MVRKAKGKRFGMGIEFELTYSVCYSILPTYVSYYYDSCLSNNYYG